MDAHRTREGNFAQRKNRIREAYRELAPIRERWIRRNRYYYRELARIVSNFIEPDGDLLQVGCGIGHLLARLPARTRTGIDLSPEMIAAARDRHPEIDFFTADAENLPEFEKTFDYILLENVVGDLVDVQEAFEQLQKCARGDSRVVIVYYNYLWEPLVKIAEKLKLKIREPIQNWLSAADIENLLFLAGFETVKRDNFLLFPKYLPGFSFLLNRIIGRLPLLNRLCFLNLLVARPRGGGQPEAELSCSVIVPCKDEARNIEEIFTRTPEMGKGTEIVFVDDRSTDRTGEIVDRLAEEDPRVVSIHVTELPEGWLGKVHALSKGLAAGDSELVLLTDADVHFRPGTLRKAVAHFEASGLDQLAAMPALWPSSSLLDGLIAMFIRQLLTIVQPWKADDPDSERFMGIGAFNMVRRAALAEAGGLEWLRMEVADDMAIGMMMKQAHFKCRVVNARGMLVMHWYQTCGQAMRCSERGWSTPGDFRAAGMIVWGAVIALLESAPAVLPILLAVVFAVSAGVPLIAVSAVGLTVTVTFLVTAGLMARWSGGRLLPSLMAPLVAGLAFFGTARAAILGLRRGGIVWRGTLYTTEALRRGRRVKLF